MYSVFGGDSISPRKTLRDVYRIKSVTAILYMLAQSDLKLWFLGSQHSKCNGGRFMRAVNKSHTCQTEPSCMVVPFVCRTKGESATQNQRVLG